MAGRRVTMLRVSAEYRGEDDLVVFDFADPRQTALWLPVNDVVMGGVSVGRMIQHTPATALFHGFVSLDNGGGFSSVRTSPAEHDLSGFLGLTVVLKGDGKRYKLNMSASGSPNTVLYQAGFETRRDQWIAVKIPFADFVPVFRGRPVTDAPALDTARIGSFGVLISEKQAGEFAIELAAITAHR